MISSILDYICAKRVIVNCDHEPYLNRWYVIRTKPLGVFVHQFVRSDEDRALHDHPWAFIVIPLWGGYIEHSDRERNLDEKLLAAVTLASDERYFARIQVRRRVWPLISIRYRSTEYRHRVELIKGRPSWSIFIRFRKVREWGFWPKSGFILWNKWWQDKCE